MTLAELCEPLFQYVCRLNRSARKGVNPELAHVRAEVNDLLAQMRAKSAAVPALKAPYEKIEIVLVYFVDWVVRTSKLAFAGSWSDLALERGKPGGDEDFFDELDKTLKDPAPDAVDRLVIFYTCLGLGFSGWFAGQPDYLRKKQQEVFGRVRGLIDANPAERITPEAYERVNTADLVEPPGTKVVGLVIVLAGLAITIIAANAALYLQRTGELKETLLGIVEASGGASNGQGGASR